MAHISVMVQIRVDGRMQLLGKGIEKTVWKHKHRRKIQINQTLEVLQQLPTHILQVLVSSVVCDLLPQVDQHMVACVIRRPEQLLHFPPPLLVPHFVVLQHRQHFVGRSAEDVARLRTKAGQRSVPGQSRVYSFGCPKGH